MNPKYNPKNKRQFKRKTHEQLERKLRVLNRRQIELYKDRYYYIELKKPIFQGYRKHFVLREDLKGRPDFSLLQRLLPLVDSSLFSETGNFTKKERRKRKKRIPIPHLPKELPFHIFEKLTHREKSYFTKKENLAYGRISLTYRWNYDWMLVPKIEKVFTDKIRLVNLNGDSELQEIDNFCTQNGLYPKMHRIIYGGGYGSKHRREDISYRLTEIYARREMRTFLSLKPEFRDENISSI